MIWNNNLILLALPFIWIILSFVAMVDLYKNRDVPSKSKRDLYAILIVFPPVLGLIIYYFIVVRNGKYLKR